MSWSEKIDLRRFYEAGSSDLPPEMEKPEPKDGGLIILNPKIGHFYFGKNRTFLNWLDTLIKFFLTSEEKLIIV